MFLRLHDSREPQWERLSTSGKTGNGAEPPMTWPAARTRETSATPGRTQNNIYNNYRPRLLFITPLYKKSPDPRNHGKLQRSKHEEQRLWCTWVHAHRHHVGTTDDVTLVTTAVGGSNNEGLKASVDLKEGLSWEQQV